MRSFAALWILGFAVSACAEDTPASLLADITRAIEERDVATAARIFDEEKMTKEELEGEIADEDRKADGHFLEILKARPELANPKEGATELTLKWVHAAEDGKLYRGKARFQREDGAWGLDKLSVDKEDAEGPGAEAGEAKEPPSQVLAGFVAAMKNKDWKALLEYCPADERDELTPEKLGEKFTESDEDAGGHFAEGVENAALVTAAGARVVGIEVELDYDVMGGSVSVELNMMKKSGAWWIADVEVDLRKPDDGK